MASALHTWSKEFKILYFGLNDKGISKSFHLINSYKYRNLIDHFALISYYEFFTICLWQMKIQLDLENWCACSTNPARLCSNKVSDSDFMFLKSFISSGKFRKRWQRNVLTRMGDGILKRIWLFHLEKKVFI